MGNGTVSKIGHCISLVFKLTPSNVVDHDRRRSQSHIVERGQRHVVPCVCMCVNAGGGLNNLALLDFSSFLTDVVNRRQWRLNVDADV